MSIYEISFSPTGGTKKVADFLANEVNRLLLAVVNMMLKKACTERKACELYL